MQLPEGVRAVKRKRATYYYWAPRRGTAAAVKPVSLGKDCHHPEFWVALRRLQAEHGVPEEGTFRRLIEDYTTSGAWDDLSRRTQVHYRHQLGRIESAWSEMAVRGLTVAGIQAQRAVLERTPVAANHFVAVLRTLLAWGLEHGYGERNPASDIRPIEIRDQQNARPWPESAYAFVLEHAPEHIRRAAFLGRATGQRRSDLVLLGKKNRNDDGLLFRISKLRGKEHFVPLATSQCETIDAWSCSDTGPWIVSPTGAPMSGDHLQSSLGRFCAKGAELKTLGLKMHGLRAMAAATARCSASTTPRSARASACRAAWSTAIPNISIRRPLRGRSGTG